MVQVAIVVHRVDRVDFRRFLKRNGIFAVLNNLRGLHFLLVQLAFQLLISLQHCHIGNNSWVHSILLPVVYQNDTYVLPWPVDVLLLNTLMHWLDGIHLWHVFRINTQHLWDLVAMTLIYLQGRSKPNHRMHLRVGFLDSDRSHGLDLMFEHRETTHHGHIISVHQLMLLNQSNQNIGHNVSIHLHFHISVNIHHKNHILV